MKPYCSALPNHHSKAACTLRIITYALVVLVLIPISARAQNVDLLPPDLRGEINSSISQVLNGFAIFSSTDAVSSGEYRVKNAGAAKSNFNVLKVSGTHFWEDEPNDSITPFVMGQIGTFGLQEEIPPVVGGGDNDFSRIRSVNAGLGAGVAIKIFDALTFSPEFQTVYTHTENEFDYNSAFAQEILKLFDGDLLNWDIETLSYMPAATLAYDMNLGALSFIPSIKYTHLFIDSIATNSELLNVKTSSGVLNTRLELRMPTGQCLFNRDLQLRPFAARTDIYRDARAGLGYGSFHQTGVALLLDTKDSIPYISRFGVSGAYSWNSDFEGWRVGFEADLS